MGKLCATVGRILVAVAALALLGAWLTQLTRDDLFGMSQQHLFSDATVLALLGVAMLLDARLHGKKD